MEEANILKKLCSEGAHRNLVKYIDSWEEDNMLFILTELYPLGNLAHFLSEYGTRFERLEEVRCWKILAELCSVSRSCSLVGTSTLYMI
jgi:mitosis inhibitor protein kinase SWE1